MGRDVEDFHKTHLIFTYELVLGSGTHNRMKWKNTKIKNI